MFFKKKEKSLKEKNWNRIEGVIKELTSFQKKTCNLFQNTDLSGVQIKKVNFENLDFKNTNFKSSYFKNCSFKNCSFESANLEEAKFELCSFRNTSFNHSIIKNSYFAGNFFSCSYFGLADVSFSNFTNAKLQGCFFGIFPFHRVAFEGADLRLTDYYFSDFSEERKGLAKEILQECDCSYNEKTLFDE